MLNIFSGCTGLLEIYSLIENPYAIDDFSFTFWNETEQKFDDTLYETIKLYVPKGKVDAYKATDGWKNFKTIVELNSDDIPATQKCAKPEISYANGKISLSCETEGVDFVSEVTVSDPKKYYDSEFTPSLTCKISVYATKEGYENSDVETREIVIGNGQSSPVGDINKDGNVTITDVINLLDIILNQ